MDRPLLMGEKILINTLCFFFLIGINLKATHCYHPEPSAFHIPCVVGDSVFPTLLYLIYQNGTNTRTKPLKTPFTHSVYRYLVTETWDPSMKKQVSFLYISLFS